MMRDDDAPPLMTDAEIHAAFKRFIETTGDRHAETELGEKTLRAVELFVGSCMLMMFKEIDRDAHSPGPPPAREP
jgi:hypothetical protein